MALKVQRGGDVQDLLIETIALKRIALISKLVTTGACSIEEKDVAAFWVDELVTELLEHFKKDCCHPTDRH